jgi:Stage II sporulation protein
MAHAPGVRIGVLGIFHPHELMLSAREGDVIVVNAAGQNIYLQARSQIETLHIRAAGDDLLLEVGGEQICAKEIYAAGRGQDATNFVLSVPGKIQRRYQGMLEVKIIGGELVPVVTMDLEEAVASVVSAESLSGTPQEALKAQAVVTRSYLVAGRGRHANFDFCDLARSNCNAGIDRHLLWYRGGDDVHAKLRWPHSNARDDRNFVSRLSLLFCGLRFLPQTSSALAPRGVAGRCGATFRS